jgi:hypothetical protein
MARSVPDKDAWRNLHTGPMRGLARGLLAGPCLGPAPGRSTARNAPGGNVAGPCRIATDFMRGLEIPE